MWGGSQTDGPSEPARAKTHTPANAHEPPRSMGEGNTDAGYIDYGANAFSDRHAEREAYHNRPNSTNQGSLDDHGADRRSERTTSTAPLNRGGAAGGIAGASDATSLRSRRTGGRGTAAGGYDDDARSYESSDRQSNLDAAYAAGMPIGLLAAMGTPYAKKPIFRSKKFKILCFLLLPIVIVIATVLLLLPILRAIAKHALNTSVLHIYTSNITNPTDLGFGLTLNGQAKKTGIFPAKIFFRNPVYVYWINPDNMTEVQLGHFALSPLGAAAGHGLINQETKLTIDDEPAFGRFTEHLITQSTFTWRLKSTGVDASAFNFIAANRLNFAKDLTLNGMGNFTDIGIADFQLPGNDPAGGITQDVVTYLTNPSAFGVEIGTLAASLYYKGMFLGPAVTSRYINLTAGRNIIPLSGRLVDQTGNQTALDLLSELFSAYLNGETSPVVAIGEYVELPDGTRVSWLNQGIRKLQLQVPLRCPTGPISPITSITIGSFGLAFNHDGSLPYAPIVGSNSTSASYGLPFGFSLNISQVQVSMAIVQNGTIIANISTPYGDSNTYTLDQNAGYESGTLNLIVPPSRLVVEDSYEAHLTYSQFQYDFFSQIGSNFFLTGLTGALTSTPIGQVNLKDIKFVVPAGLAGLGRLTVYPTDILSVDVIGGTPTAIILQIEVGLTNPSNLILDVGNVTLQLYDFYDGSYLGVTILPDLLVTIGQQTHTSIGYFEANNNPTALSILTKFTQGLNSQLAISGFNGSSRTESLEQVFMDTHLNTTLYGLNVKLLNYANLTVLETTGRTDNNADSIVSLNNPFSAALDITNIQSNITARGLYIGAINQNTNFNAGGKAAGQAAPQINISPTLSFGLNLYPPDIFSLLRQLVVDQGMDPTPLDGIVQLGGYQYVPTTTGPKPPGVRSRKRGFVPDDEDPSGYVWNDGDEEEQAYEDTLLNPIKGDFPGAATGRVPMYFPEGEQTTFAAEGAGGHGFDDFDDLLMEPTRRSAPGAGEEAPHRRLGKRQSAAIYKGFNLPSYVLEAFRALTVNIDLISVVNIGEFTTDLAYTQENVPAYTDSSLLLLLPVLAAPIVQKIVDGSILAIDSILITNPQLNNFGTHLVGSITQAGPFDATINFPQGLIVYWNGAPLGQIAMPDIALVGDVGASLNLDAAFAVADVGHLTDFTRYLLTEPNFTWTIEGSQLAVSALGITVPGISISKTVVLAGLNGLKNDVTITHFDLPYNDPAGGIHLTIDTQIVNPSAVGVELSALSFINSFGSTIIGPAAAANPFTLSPKSTISLPLAGRLVPQTSDQGLQDVSTIFNGFIHGVPSTVVVSGDSAGPDGVTWLNEGIKALSTPVILPAAAELQIITSITIYQITLIFTEATAWNPAFSTDNTIADFTLPFAFPLDIQQTAAMITSVDQNTGFALLNVPKNPSVTDVVARTILLTFANVPFAVFDNTHAIFSQFLLDTTQGVSKTFGLTGTADTVASTAVGLLNVNGIGFSVSTTIAGLQGLNAQPAFVTDLDVYHGYPSYLQINANAHLFNPSNITIGTGDVTFGLNFMDEMIGVAFIQGLLLVPGMNVIPTQVRYQPQGTAEVAAGQLLLENFVQRIVSTTIISGNDDTTPIESLKAALGSIRLSTDIPPLMQNLIVRAQLVFPTNIVQTGIANANFDLSNPFTASINLLAVVATAIYPQGNLNLGQINVPNINPIISAPGHTQIRSYFLPLNFNLDPKVIIQLLEFQAAKNGVDLGPLPPFFAYVLGLSEDTLSALKAQIPTQVLAGQTSSGNAPQCVSGNQFDVFGAILAALQNLFVTLQIQSTVKLDDYQTNLDFNQYDVPAITDRTALYLIGAVGPPIVQEIVNQAVLTVQNANVTNVTDTGFTAALLGSLTNAGPFDAYIIFPDGVDVYFMGTLIANIVLPPICSPANVNVPVLSTTGILTIRDLGAFTNFATYILHNPSFEWLLLTNSLRVEALGTQFDGVILSKTISFQAFNNLPGTVLVNFDLPGDAPNGAGINIKTNALIPSPATLGIELGTANFITSFMGNEVGPVHSINLFLALLTTTDALLEGTIIPQSGDGIRTIGILFSEFLQGVNQTLQATGDSVITPAQPSRPVNWLSAAFKTLTIDVILPGKIYTIITMVQLANIQIAIRDQSEAYAVDASSTEADATYQNPFTFSLQAIQAAVDATINFRGTDTAQLNLPLEQSIIAGTSTGQPVPLRIAFKNETLQSLNNPSFNDFFAQVTDTDLANFVLHGGANVIAKTAIGNIPISGIPFSVNSYLPGINSFGHVGQIPNPPIAIGSGGGGLNSFDETFGADFIRITIVIILNNPSTTSITSNQVSFEVMYQNALVGRATVTNLVLVPGNNSVAGEFHYGPTDPTNSDLVTQYLQRPSYKEGSTDLIPIFIKGDSQSSPYGSLVEALEGVTINSAFPGLGTKLVNFIQVNIDFVTAFCNDTVAIQFKINNTLSTQIFVINLDALAAQPRGDNYASLTSATLQPTPFPAAANSITGFSQNIPNVVLLKGLIGSLPILTNQFDPTKGLDLTTTIRTSIEQTSGYIIPQLKYNQDTVPYNTSLAFGGLPLSLSGLTDLPGTLTSIVGVLTGAATSCTGAGLQVNLTCAQLVAINPIFQPLCAVLDPLEGVLCEAVVTITQVLDPLGAILSLLPAVTALPVGIATRAICTATSYSTTTVSSTNAAATVQALVCSTVITPIVTGFAEIAGLLPVSEAVAVIGGVLQNGYTALTSLSTSVVSVAGCTSTAQSTAASTTLSGLRRRSNADQHLFIPYGAFPEQPQVGAAYQTEHVAPATAGPRPTTMRTYAYPQATPTTPARRPAPLSRDL